VGDDTQTSLTIIQTGDGSSSMPSLGSKSPVAMGEWRRVQANRIGLLLGASSHKPAHRWSECDGRSLLNLGTTVAFVSCSNGRAALLGIALLSS